MLNSDLSVYTHEQLSRYAHEFLATSTSLSLEYIVDRTQQDVDRWHTLRNKGWSAMTEDERREWLGETHNTPNAAKGMYTHNDMNRVELLVKTLSKKLRDLGYTLPELSTKTTWSMGDEVSEADMVRYLKNVDILRNSIATPHGTPVTPSITSKWNYVSANDIEKILMNIDDVTTKLTKTWYYTGELYAGEV